MRRPKHSSEGEGNDGFLVGVTAPWSRRIINTMNKQGTWEEYSAFARYLSGEQSRRVNLLLTFNPSLRSKKTIQVLTPSNAVDNPSILRANLRDHNGYCDRLPDLLGATSPLGQNMIRTTSNIPISQPVPSCVMLRP